MLTRLFQPQIRESIATAPTFTSAITNDTYWAEYIPTKQQIAISSYGGQAVYFYSPSSNSVTATVTPTGSLTMRESVYCPSNNKLYCCTTGSKVVVIDCLGTPAVNTILTTIPCAGTPCYCDYDNYIYAADYASGSITVINPATNAVITTITGSASTINGVFYNQRTKKVWGLNANTGELKIINPASAWAITTLTVSASAALAYATGNVDHSKIYISSNATNKLFIINSDTNAVTSITLTASLGVGYIPSIDRIVCCISGGTLVTVINPINNVVTTTFAFSTGGRSVGWIPYCDRYFIGSSAVSYIAVGNPALLY